MKTALRIVLLTTALIALAACGNKGPLVPAKPDSALAR
jgi:predicted small lipoprotein YifL